MPSLDVASRKHPKTICLFDVDGTLTPARQHISKAMLEKLKALKEQCVLGFVGGSDLSKQKEQLTDEGFGVFDFAFAENGLNAFQSGQLIATQSFIRWIGEEKYKKLVNFILKYIADIEIPVKRGTFIEFRNGMINVSPIGRNCTNEERNAFEEYDLKHKIRETMVLALKKEFPDYDLTYSIGGQISFDVFPTGWDKTYCLRHLKSFEFMDIHFFGDKTYPGGNDYEIFTHPSVKGHAVQTPEDTMRILDQLFWK